jgi:hypothetical protein
MITQRSINKNRPMTATQSHKTLLTGGALVLAITSSLFAQEKPFMQAGTGQPPLPAPPVKPAAAAPPAAVAETNPVDKFFNGQIPDAIARGKFNLNARLRYEFVDQDGVAAITDDSHAVTLRTRFGFTTAPLSGFQAMLEGEDITVIGPKANFNAAGSNGKGYKPVVPDPPTTELNQAWLSYSYTNLFTIKGGRQRIVLDNHRFIGDVGWRQNMQTFDAIGAEVKPLPDLSVYYGYVWDVHRVFGDVPGLPPANRDFDSSSHLINVSYSGCPYGRITAYSYLLDLENAAGAANSSATYGGYFAGNAPLNEKVSIAYRAEGALQTDYANSPLDYSAEYYNLELSASMKPFAFGAGYEVLGTDNGTSFRTPLSTLHAFNGWADMFVNTPARGLKDIYAFAQVTLPQQVPLRFVYHKFDADSGGGDYGQEFDIVASRKFGKNWTALLKYALYNGEDAAPPAITAPNVDVHKFWAQVEFNF